MTNKAAIESVTGRPLVISGGVCPHTSGLHLDAVGVEVSSSGGIVVNAMQQSSVPHIYAVGDCTGGRALAGIPLKQGKKAAKTLTRPRGQISPLLTPMVVYTTPRIAADGDAAQETAPARS